MSEEEKIEPITRKEHLLNGEDIEPETREEAFVKHIFDKDQPIPEPITRKEHLLKRAGDLKLIEKEITEPGTYKAADDGADGYSIITVKGDK